VLYGAGDAELQFRYKSKTGRFDYQGAYEGVIPNLERRFRDSESDAVREKISAYMREGACRACAGSRLKPEALAVRIEGRSIADWTRLDVAAARRQAAGLASPATARASPRPSSRS